MNDSCAGSSAQRTTTILIVDDNPENLAVLSELLHPEFQVRAAKSGEQALALAGVAPRPDLILLDVMMPDMDGFTVLAHLRRDARVRDIPVLFLTALDRQEDQLRGFDLGAVDYITKPILPPVVLARVRAQLALKRSRDLLRDQNAWLETEVDRRMRENELVQTVGIRALAHLAETRDPETGNHILRTQGYVRHLAGLLAAHPRFRADLDGQYIELLARSAPLHDIGKVGIPDAILLKPGPLTPEEWTVMRTHARLGAEAIEQAERDAVTPVAFLGLAKEIARWHHEKWDGTGYPDGLAGEAIPVSARLMALADVFDALISPRVYKLPMTYPEAREIITAGSGQHFDPDAADTFLAHFDTFVGIAEAYRDPPGRQVTGP
ncbi:MAG: two-component system response regulator [Thiobacillus sp.]|nr:two-component system response regulator [Thiobacillus sp.]